jgi:membrane-bound metal-dependent hydrolase YbcI (DUF457 family)
MHPYHGWPFLTSPQHPNLTAAGAVVIHGCLTLLVVLPIVWRSRNRAAMAALAFLAGPALDLDHVAAAGSFRAQALENLGHRPFIHSLLFALVATGLALLITRRGIFAWSLFAVIVSHLLFDAAGGGEYWLWPLTHPDSMPWLICPAGALAILAISAAVSRRMPPVQRDRPISVSRPGPSRRASWPGTGWRRPGHPASPHRRPG